MFVCVCVFFFLFFFFFLGGGWIKQIIKFTLHDLNVCDIIVMPQDVAKDLGVLWDTQMTMVNQIAKVCNIYTASSKYHEN